MGALLFCSTYEEQLPYPMDAHFVLSIGACLYGLLYVASLFISVQFRGDFGVVGDPNTGGPTVFSGLVDSAQFVPRNSPSRFGNQFQSSASNGFFNEGCAAMLPTECIESISTCTSEVFDIPARDFSLLFYPPTSSYGSRLHSAKIDLKEV